MAADTNPSEPDNQASAPTSTLDVATKDQFSRRLIHGPDPPYPSGWDSVAAAVHSIASTRSDRWERQGRLQALIDQRKIQDSANLPYAIHMIAYNPSLGGVLNSKLSELAVKDTAQLQAEISKPLSSGVMASDYDIIHGEPGWERCMHIGDALHRLSGSVKEREYLTLSHNGSTEMEDLFGGLQTVTLCGPNARAPHQPDGHAAHIFTQQFLEDWPRHRAAMVELQKKLEKTEGSTWAGLVSTYIKEATEESMQRVNEAMARV